MSLLNSIFLLVTLLSSSHSLLDRRLITKICPDESELCIKKAANGDCFGSSLKASVLQKQCKCSCNTVHHDRIQSCCREVGEKDMKFCMPLCGYNTTLEDLGSTLGIKCVSQLTTWAYCASDNFDVTPCCTAKGVPSDCLSFCQGKVPTCDMQSIFQYQGCLQFMKQIISCQKGGLLSSPRFDPDWSSSCEWEGKK